MLDPVTKSNTPTGGNFNSGTEQPDVIGASTPEAGGVTLNDELGFRVKIDPFLEEHFHVEREVRSTTGRRIDYVLMCKRSNVLFGLEVKSTKHMTRQWIARFLMQANDYSKLRWKTSFSPEPVKVMVFIAPAVSNTVKQVIPESMRPIPGTFNETYQSYHASTHDHTNVNSFISEAFNVGEIRQPTRGRVIFSFMNKIIWSNTLTGGLHQTNYEFYTNRTCRQ